MKTIWAKIFKASLQKLGSARFDFMPDGDGIQMSCRRIGSHTLTMSELKTFIHAVFYLILDKCRTLLPEGVELPDIDFDNVINDTTQRESFVDSPAITALLRPIQQVIWEKIWCSLLDSNGNFVPSKAEAYLQKDQVFLASLALVLLCLCGKPPRGYQAVDLCYRPDGSDERHLHVLNGFAVLGWSRRHRVRGKTNRNAYLWVLPRMIGWALTIYLAIFRPIIITIIQRLGRSTAAMDTHIFVDSAHKTTAIWTGPKFTLAIRSLLPMKYRAFDDRSFGELFSSIASRHLSLIINNMHKGVYRTFLNAQGGHSDETSWKHYGLDSDGYHSAFKMSRIHVETCWATSEVWQAFWGLNMLDERWRTILHGNRTFEATDKLKYAWEVSRRAVLSYFMGCADPTSIASRVQETIHSRSFFLPQVSVPMILENLIYRIILGIFFVVLGRWRVRGGRFSSIVWVW